jgi:hypothetical protein
VIEVLMLIDERALPRLQDDIRYITDRLAELAAMIDRLNLPATSYRLQELKSEQSTLQAHHRAIQTKINELTGDNPDHERALKDRERTEKIRQSIVEKYRRDCIARATDFERQGDYRNASLTRLEALNARRVAEHEVH